jgi:hypothetical protein
VNFLLCTLVSFHSFPYFPYLQIPIEKNAKVPDSFSKEAFIRKNGLRSLDTVINYLD